MSDEKIVDDSGPIKIKWSHLTVVLGIMSLVWMRMYFLMKADYLDCIGGG